MAFLPAGGGLYQSLLLGRGALRPVLLPLLLVPAGAAGGVGVVAKRAMECATKS